MSLKYSISVLALASALIASPPTFAQLGVSLGGDDGLDVGVDVNADDGLDVDADVGLGGDAGVDVGADLGVGDDDDLVGADLDANIGGQDDDDEAVDADIGVGVGRDDSLVDLDTDARVLDDGDEDEDGPLIDLDADATVGGEEQLIDADADVDADVGGGVVNGDSLLGLGSGAQSDALIALVAQTNLATVDLDATVDDQRVIIVDVDDTFSNETLAELDVALASGDTGGVDESQAAVSASVVLSSVLANNGLSADDVLALQIGEQGQTYVYVRPDLEDAANVVADADLAGDEITDADVTLLSEETVADANVDILSGDGDDTEEPLVDVDANISNAGERDDQGLGGDADVDIAGEDVADADVGVLGGNALADANVDILPDTGTEDNGVNADADIGLGDTDIADVALDVLDDSLLSSDLVVLPGSDSGDDGVGGGDDDAGGGDSAGGGDDDAGGDDSAGGGDDGAGGGGDDGVNVGAGNEGAADTPVGTTPNAASDTVMGQSGTIECPADIRPFLEATASADALMAATQAEVVLLTGCPSDGLLQTADFSRLRTVIERLPVTQAALDAAAVPFEDVVSATVSGDAATIYAIE